jgi:hypothetical protein
LELSALSRLAQSMMARPWSEIASVWCRQGVTDKSDAIGDLPCIKERMEANNGSASDGGQISL